MAPWFDSTLGMHQRKDEQNLLFVSSLHFSPVSRGNSISILYRDENDEKGQKEAEEKGEDQ